MFQILPFKRFNDYEDKKQKFWSQPAMQRILNCVAKNVFKMDDAIRLTSAPSVSFLLRLNAINKRKSKPKKNKPSYKPIKNVSIPKYP